MGTIRTYLEARNTKYFYLTQLLNTFVIFPYKPAYQILTLFRNISEAHTIIYIQGRADGHWGYGVWPLCPEQGI